MLIVATLEALAWFLAFDVMNNEGVPYCCPFPPVVVFAMVRGLFVYMMFFVHLYTNDSTDRLSHISPLTNHKKTYTITHTHNQVCELFQKTFSRALLLVICLGYGIARPKYVRAIDVNIYEHVCV